MSTYEYQTKISRGWPLVKKTLAEVGQRGWLLVGVVRSITQSDSTDEQPYPIEEFWYYFARRSDSDTQLDKRSL